MKKVLSICLVLVMAFSFGMTAFAAPSGFVSSPSENQAPVVDEFKPADDDCQAKITIISYAERENFPKEYVEALEDAFKELSETDDITELSPSLKDVADKKNIKPGNLLISDLFDVYSEGCDAHENHKEFEITLLADTLKNFVALIQRNPDGTWEVVSNAKVVKNGKAIRFTVDSFSPFAIVVGKTPVSPQTDDNAPANIYVIFTAVIALAAIVGVKKIKS